MNAATTNVIVSVYKIIPNLSTPTITVDDESELVAHHVEARVTKNQGQWSCTFSSSASLHAQVGAFFVIETPEGKRALIRTDSSSIGSELHFGGFGVPPV